MTSGQIAAAVFGGLVGGAIVVYFAANRDADGMAVQGRILAERATRRAAERVLRDDYGITEARMTRLAELGRQLGIGTGAST